MNKDISHSVAYRLCNLNVQNVK